MTLLRRHRRDHRARASRKRKRRNLVKFIPTADSDFAFTASRFVQYLTDDAGRFGVPAEEVSWVAKPVAEFRAALALTLNKKQRNQDSTRAKDEARRRAEAMVRRFANIIRANPRITPETKALLRIGERPRKLRKRKCPRTPPQIVFFGSGDGHDGGVADQRVGCGSGVHVLKFFDRDPQGNMFRAKPPGAARIDIYVELVPPGEDVPEHPAQRTGRPWFLRSFTKSPIEVEFPIPSEPMLVVYWGRWADASGEVGRFSKPCVARVEGWTSTRHAERALPEGAAIQQRIVFIQQPCQLPDHLEGDEDAATANDAIAALMEGGQQMLEAASVRLLNAA